MKSTNAQLQMRKGVLELCILAIINQDDSVYSSDILEALKQEDLIVVEGTLYPLLNRLKKNGYLEYEWQESTSGPPRKYFKLSDDGKSHLQELKGSWGTMVDSVNKLLA